MSETAAAEQQKIQEPDNVPITCKINPNFKPKVQEKTVKCSLINQANTEEEAVIIGKIGELEKKLQEMQGKQQTLQGQQQVQQQAQQQTQQQGTRTATTSSKVKSNFVFSFNKDTTKAFFDNKNVSSLLKSNQLTKFGDKRNKDWNKVSCKIKKLFNTGTDVDLLQLVQKISNRRTLFEQLSKFKNKFKENLSNYNSDKCDSELQEYNKAIYTNFNEIHDIENMKILMNVFVYDIANYRYPSVCCAKTDFHKKANTYVGEVNADSIVPDSPFLEETANITNQGSNILGMPEIGKIKLHHEDCEDMYRVWRVQPISNKVIHTVMTELYAWIDTFKKIINQVDNPENVNDALEYQKKEKDLKTLVDYIIEIKNNNEGINIPKIYTKKEYGDDDKGILIKISGLIECLKNINRNLTILDKIYEGTILNVEPLAWMTCRKDLDRIKNGKIERHLSSEWGSKAWQEEKKKADPENLEELYMDSKTLNYQCGYNDHKRGHQITDGLGNKTTRFIRRHNNFFIPIERARVLLYVSTNTLSSFKTNTAVRTTTRIGYRYKPCQANQYLNFKDLTNYYVNTAEPYELWQKRGDWDIEAAKSNVKNREEQKLIWNEYEKNKDIQYGGAPQGYARFYSDSNYVKDFNSVIFATGDDPNGNDGTKKNNVKGHKFKIGRYFLDFSQHQYKLKNPIDTKYYDRPTISGLIYNNFEHLFNKYNVELKILDIDDALGKENKQKELDARKEKTRKALEAQRKEIEGYVQQNKVLNDRKIQNKAAAKIQAVQKGKQQRQEYNTQINAITTLQQKERVRQERQERLYENFLNELNNKDIYEVFMFTTTPKDKKDKIRERVKQIIYDWEPKLEKGTPTNKKLKLDIKKDIINERQLLYIWLKTGEFGVGTVTKKNNEAYEDAKELYDGEYLKTKDFSEKMSKMSADPADLDGGGKKKLTNKKLVRSQKKRKLKKNKTLRK